MHKILYILSGCMLLLLTQQVFAQAPVMEVEEEKIATLTNESNRKHAIKLNLLSVLNKSVTVSYENTLCSHAGLQVGVFYSKNNYLGAASRLSFTPEVRFYFSAKENALVGFYAGPYLKYQAITSTDELANDATVTASVRTMGGGIILGRQWIAKQGFTVDLFAGGGYNPSVSVPAIKLSDASSTYTVNTSRWRTDIRAGVAIGYAF
jgi:hypothetical protein